MKKALIAILVIMTVSCATVFAADGYEDYSGINIGFGYSTATIHYGLEWTEKSNPLYFSASEYAFFEGSPVGLYGDLALTIPLNFKVNDQASDNSRVGFFAGIGPAFRFETSNKVSVILGVGFHFYTTSYSTSYEYWKEVRNYFGVGGDLTASYKFSRHFAFNAGFQASIFFANTGKIVDRYRPSRDVSYDSYSEVRVIPKLGVYYVY
jgi:hypothetical protein